MDMLAQTQELDQTIEPQRQQFITFTVQGYEYGIDIMSIREIKGWTETTSLPNSPNYMRGVINLRGTVVPIMDLRARFGMGDTDAKKNHVVMIVNIGARLMGVLVDGVSDILTVDTTEIREVPEVDGSNHGDILKGLVSLETRMVGLLILEGLFDQSVSVSQRGGSGAFMDSFFDAEGSRAPIETLDDPLLRQMA